MSVNKVKKTLFNGYFVGKIDCALRRNYPQVTSDVQTENLSCIMLMLSP